MNSIRVLVVDDHPLMREALSAALAAEEDLEVVGEATNGAHAVSLAQTLQPDLIIMDLLMPGMDGVTAMQTIRAQMPQARLLVFTSSTDPEQILAAVQSGALGYLQKDAQRDELLTAIRHVSRGDAHLPAAIALKLVQQVQRPAGGSTEGAGDEALPLGRLTPRQREVLELLAEGLSTQEVAARLVLSEATVRSHIFHLLGALGLENRHQAVRQVLRHSETGPLAPPRPAKP